MHEDCVTAQAFVKPFYSLAVHSWQYSLFISTGWCIQIGIAVSKITFL